MSAEVRDTTPPMRDETPFYGCPECALDTSDPEDHAPAHARAERDDALLRELARDLYQLHLDTGISLDDWQSARTFVERFYGPIPTNGA